MNVGWDDGEFQASDVSALGWLGFVVLLGCVGIVSVAMVSFRTVWRREQ